MRLAALVIACIVPLAASPAFAAENELRIAVHDHPSWPAAVAALQSDVSAEGTLLHVGVTQSDGSRVACGRYALALDAIGAAAFTIGACDPATDETSVVLAHRAALFAHDDIVPEPLAAGIAATLTLTGSAAGGAESTGGSALQCSVSVQPYLTDLEHGTRVNLVPGRFVLRPIAANVAVAARDAGWQLSAATSGSLVVEYDVYDTQRNRVVTHDLATLQCATESLAPPVAPAPEPPPVVAPVAIVTPPAPIVAAPPASIALPNVSLSFSSDAGSIAYIPIGGVTFRHDFATARGRDFQLASVWAFAPSAGIALDMRWLHAELATTALIGDRFLGLEARATGALALQFGAFRAYAGGTATLTLLTLTHGGVVAGDWQSEPLSGFAATAGIGWRTARRNDRGAIRISEVHLDATVPVIGTSAFIAGIGFAFGGGL